MQDFIKNRIIESIQTKSKLLENQLFVQNIEKAVKVCTETFQKNGVVLFCGNGGSAADAQHLAAEFSGRFYFDREPLNSEALHVNTSYLTAVGNDYSFDEVYARLVRAKGHKGDVLFAISTSGNSPNILKAIEAAKKLDMTVVGLTGETGGKMAGICDILLNVPSKDTPRIQECHILTGHIICELVESSLFSKPVE
jgi:D-sedoheptulose 7-phosphate isomerase